MENQVFNTILTEILKVAVAVLIPIVAKEFVALRDKIEKNIEVQMGKTNYEYAVSVVKDIVHYVEQTNPELAGDKKYAVASQAISKKLGNLLTSEEIEQLIESAVKQMNISIKASASQGGAVKTSANA